MGLLFAVAREVNNQGYKGEWCPLLEELKIFKGSILEKFKK